MKKIMLLYSLLLSGYSAYSSETIRILYPMDSPTEIEISKRLKETVKKELDINIEYVPTTNSELESKFIVMEKTKNNTDIVIIQDVSNIKQFLEPLNEYTNKYNFNKGALEFFTEDNELLAVPVGMVVYGFMGNNFKAEKIEDLKGKKTSIANGTERHSFRNFYMYAIANGINATDVDSAKFENILDMYKNVVIQDTHKTDKYPDMFKQYAENKVDFIVTGSYHVANQQPWGLDNLKNSQPFVIGDKTYIGVSGPAISKSSKNKALAKKIIDIYMRKDIINEKLTTMDIPAYDIELDNSSLSDDVRRINSEWKKIADKYGISMPKIKNQSRIEKNYRDNIILFLEERQNARRTINNIKKYINTNN